jgi:aryl-phospho-beta-D-glucosidase BglC (GH1 family)
MRLGNRERIIPTGFLKNVFKWVNGGVAALLIVAVALMLEGSNGCGRAEDINTDKKLDDILRVKGNQVMNGRGQTVFLRGVGFGNRVWDDTVNPPTVHHDRRDYRRVADMNMNVIRFGMNYGVFEDDTAPFVYKESGFAWLDQNIQWAKEHGIYLMLNMHIPQGGFQSDCEGEALWKIPKNQDRLVSLWKAIAKHYANESVIAGYAILNEPAPPSQAEWKTLSGRIVKAIREVDSQHMIVVEHTEALIVGPKKCNYLPWKNTVFLLDDPNVMYEFHSYEPGNYTGQGVHADTPKDGGRYPDAMRTDGYINTDETMPRVKASLEKLLRTYADWGIKNNVPLFMGEFGAGIPTMKDGKGGLRWVEDMLDIAMELGMHFSYWSYHENYFGIYPGDGKLPDPATADQQLIDLLTRKLQK